MFFEIGDFLDLGEILDPKSQNSKKFRQISGSRRQISRENFRTNTDHLDDFVRLVESYKTRQRKLGTSYQEPLQFGHSKIWSTQILVQNRFSDFGKKSRFWVEGSN